MHYLSSDIHALKKQIYLYANNAMSSVTAKMRMS